MDLDDGVVIVGGLINNLSLAIYPKIFPKTKADKKLRTRYKSYIYKVRMQTCAVYISGVQFT